jgi:hypothetical protein
MFDPDDPSVPVEYRLIHDASLLDIQVLDSQVSPTIGDEDWQVHLKLQVDADLIETCAHGLLFAVGVLSFHDGRPRGVSGAWFEDGDQFRAADMLTSLRFVRRELIMYVDYLRGRCIKTLVAVGSDGKVRLETVNRGKAALTWVAKLQGKKMLQAVSATP